MANTKKNSNSKKNQPKKSATQSSVISGLLIVGIAIITFLFILSAMKVLFERPAYGDFCKYEQKYPRPRFDDEPNCTNQPEYPDCGEGIVRETYDENGCISEFSCDFCNVEYEKQRENYSKNIFIISLIVGIALIIGSSFIAISTIQNGLFISSIVTIIYGTAGFWEQLGKYMQLIFLGIALASILILAYKTQQKLKK